MTLSEIDASSLKIAKFPSGASISSLLSERMDNVALLVFLSYLKSYLEELSAFLEQGK